MMAGCSSGTGGKAAMAQVLLAQICPSSAAAKLGKLRQSCDKPWKANMGALNSQATPQPSPPVVMMAR